MDLAHEKLGRAVRLSVYGSLLCTGAALIITVASPECREPENKKKSQGHHPGHKEWSRVYIIANVRRKEVFVLTGRSICPPALFLRGGYAQNSLAFDLEFY